MKTPNASKEGAYSVSSSVGLVDTHCHLDFLFRKTRHRGSFEKFRENHQDTFPPQLRGVRGRVLRPGYLQEGIGTSGGAFFPRTEFGGAFGCHPHMARLYDEDIEEAMVNALEHPRVVALGEIGLDYSSNNKCDHPVQQRVLRRQLTLARRGKMPLVIHSRDASMDTLRILKEEMPADWSIHRHCYTGDWAEAKEWMDTFPNLCIGLTPLVGFRNAGPVAEVARRIPLDRLLLETDAPYFLPKSESGRLSQSHPGMAIHVATQLSTMRGIPLEDILWAVYLRSSQVGLIDTHCHLEFLFRKIVMLVPEDNRESFAYFRFAYFRNKHQAALPNNYEECVAVFCDPETFKKVWALRGGSMDAKPALAPGNTP
ncbi:hypothetical protein MTO96_047860 [Rhipicephalus appendiculatus]